MLITVTNRKMVFELVDRLATCAEALGVRDGEVERLIGLRGGAWPLSGSGRELWWPTDEQSERIASLFEVCTNVVWLMGDDARVWIRKHNTCLGCSPLRFMLMGGHCVDRLREMIRLEQGQC